MKTALGIEIPGYAMKPLRLLTNDSCWQVGMLKQSEDEAADQEARMTAAKRFMLLNNEHFTEVMRR